MNALRSRSLVAVVRATVAAAAAAWWVAAPAAAVSPGERVYGTWCAGCHTDSPFAPGTTVLRALRGPDRAVLAERRDLPAVLIRTMVRRGYAGMPSFRRTEIGAEELEALVDYLAMPATPPGPPQDRP